MRQHLWKVLAAGLGLAAAPGAHAQVFTPGNLVVSRSVYNDTGLAAQLVAGQSKLPGGGTATAGGAYPSVFNNDTVDASFGVTSAIFLDNVTTGGTVVNTFALDPAQIVTSFPSKSEPALNLSTDGTALTFMGYQAPLGALDVSNSNTPGAFDASNPVGLTFNREVAQVSASGSVQLTTTNAYSGNNGRAAILDSADNQYLTVGNAGNGGNPQPAGVVNGAGVQSVTPGTGATTKVGGFSVTQINPLTGQPYSATADKLGKDDNFRGETVFNNTLYVTKGSGGNGIDTVYQVGASGALPTGTNNAITVLPGFNPVLASKTNQFHPFGLFFANTTTLYVADEGMQSLTDTLANNTSAGLEKWSLAGGLWNLDYTLQNGLNLDATYTVTGTDLNGDAGTYTAATDGLRNITGRVNADGTVTIYGITSTVSTAGDQGADPNKLVAITDRLGATSLPVGEQFVTLQTAGYGQVLRGVSFAPSAAAVPEPSPLALLALPLAGLLLAARRRKAA